MKFLNNFLCFYTAYMEKLTLKWEYHLLNWHNFVTNYNTEEVKQNKECRLSWLEIETLNNMKLKLIRQTIHSRKIHIKISHISPLQSEKGKWFVFEKNIIYNKQ